MNKQYKLITITILHISKLCPYVISEEATNSRKLILTCARLTKTVHLGGNGK